MRYDQFEHYALGFARAVSFTDSEEGHDHEAEALDRFPARPLDQGRRGAADEVADVEEEDGGHRGEVEPRPVAVDLGFDWKWQEEKGQFCV